MTGPTPDWGPPPTPGSAAPPPPAPATWAPPPASWPPPGPWVPLPPSPPRPPALGDRPADGVRWGLPDAAIVIALFPVTIGLGLGYQLLHLPAREGPFELVAGGAAYAIVAAALVIVSRRRGLRRLAADFGLRFRPVDLAIGLGIMIAGKIGVAIAAGIAYGVTGHGPTRGNVSFGSDPVWIIVNGLLLASIAAPVIEELVFRGLLLRAVRNAIMRGRRRAPHPQPVGATRRGWASAVAIVVSGALFSGLHLYQTIGDLSLFLTIAIGFFVVGALHALITVVTGRLGSAIVSHVLGNALGVVVALAMLPR